jgi:hypothetical protein
MSFSLNDLDDLDDELTRIGDQVTDNFADVGQDISDGGQDLADSIGDATSDLPNSLDDLNDSFDRSDLAEAFDGSAFNDIFGRSGIPGFDGNANIQNLNDIAGLAESLPFGLGDPDSTGEVRIASSLLTRQEFLIGASLSAAPRIIDALGADNVVSVDVAGASYAYYKSYEDPVSGFSAVRLSGYAFGAEVFAIDGLQVGSRADEIAAGTLGRIQVESDAFRQMIDEAVSVGLQQGRPVLFVGPSLGGAIAQVAAYETAEAYVRADVGFGPFAVQLITIDPLGGRDAAEAINGGTLDARALGLIAGLNIRTEGDVVSRIGSHIGSTWTLPALDANGNVVQLDAADAHVNIVSLLQNISDDTLFSRGREGAPAEISGFAAASNAASDAAIDAYLASDPSGETTPSRLQVPGNASFDPTGTVYSLDADENGTVDIAVQLRSPVSPGTADLVL